MIGFFLFFTLCVHTGSAVNKYRCLMSDKLASFFITDEPLKAIFALSIFTALVLYKLYHANLRLHKRDA